MLNNKYVINCPTNVLQLKINTVYLDKSDNNQFAIENQTYLKISGLLGTVFVCVRKESNSKLNLFNYILNEADKNETPKLVLNTAMFNETKLLNTFHKELRNKIVGITKGMYCYMQLKGLGFRSQIKNGNLILRAGLSCLSYIKLYSTVRIKRIKKHTLKIFGVDIQNYQDIRLRIQKIRMPSAYNDRGLIFKGEVRKLKQGKRSKY